jgi:hypothetical protein
MNGSRKSLLAALIALFSSVALTTGCGGPYDSSISGTVTLAGQALPHGTVTFKPLGTGPLAYGRIQSDGTYTIFTGREEGLVSGEYVASVLSVESAPPPANGGPPAAGKYLTPPWYHSPDTSGLKFNVASGSNEINLELTKTPPAGWKPAARRR